MFTNTGTFKAAPINAVQTHRHVKQSADELIDWIRGYAATRLNSRLMDERRSIAPHVMLDFGNQGLLGMQISKHYGGLDFSLRDTIRVLEQLAATDMTLGTFVACGTFGGRLIEQYATEAKKDELLPAIATGRELTSFAVTEPGAGSNLAAVSTAAVPDGRGGWRLTGEKRWVSCAAWSNTVNVFAQTFDETGKSIGMTGFLVHQDMPGVSLGPEALTMGLRGMVQNTLSLDNVSVQSEHLLGELGDGNTIAQSTMQFTRLCLGGASVGGMKRCLQLMHRYTSRRALKKGALLDNPLTLAHLGELTAATASVEALVNLAATRLDLGQKVPDEMVIACKVLGSEFLWQAADTLMQFTGGRGYEENNIIPQIFRDARIFRVFEGPTEALNAYLGVRALASNELYQFLALFDPHTADRLAEVSRQIKARCLELKDAFANRATALSWAYALIGPLVNNALLTAATQHTALQTASPILTHAASWSRQRFEQSLHSALEQARIVPPTADKITHFVSEYIATIGDAKQNLPGVDESIDPLLAPTSTIAKPQTSADAQMMVHWQHQLSDTLSYLSLPTYQLPQPGQSYQPEYHTFILNEELAEKLRVLARLWEMDLYKVLLAGFQTLLYRYTNQTDILIGSSTLPGAPTSDPAHAVTALRIDLSQQPTFEEVLEQVAVLVSEVRRYGNCPVTLLLERGHADNPASLFQVTFDFGEPRTGRTTYVATPELALHFEPVGEQLVGNLIYDTNLFTTDTIERMAQHFETLLCHVAADSQTPISELALLTDKEERKLLIEWNDTQMGYPEQCIHHLFEAQVEQNPAEIAVISGETRLTYHTLNERANKVAHFLTLMGVGPETLVGLCVDRSEEMIIGLLGILKAGGAYIPLDPAYPQERLSFMMEDAGISVLLTQEKLSAAMSMSIPHDVKVICLDRDWDSIDWGDETNPDVALTAENLAYVIYTSGSTGKPKGVEVRHRGISNVAMAQQQTFNPQPGDVVLQLASLSFDAATFEVVMALLSGATLLMKPADLLPGPEFGQFLDDNAVSMLVITPSALANVPVESLPTLKTIIVAGEACPANLVDQWATGRSFFNAYGPTENSIWSTVKRCYPFHGTPLIGQPIVNNQVYILDQHKQPVPVGVVGELHLGGVGLARGYLNRPNLTAERFIDSPFEVGARLYKTGDLARYLPNGDIEFLGRIDNQVKIRGFRIELGEIEAALTQHQQVNEAAVIVRPNQLGENQIVAYVVATQSAPLTSLALQQYVADKLPPHMRPAAVVMLDAMPLTPNSKIDRRALPEPQQQPAQAIIAPRTDTEKGLLEIWQEVLDAKFGIYDSFFDLGGHSLIAVHITARAREMFDIDELPATILFELSTIADLAEHIDDITDEREVIRL